MRRISVLGAVLALLLSTVAFVPTANAGAKWSPGAHVQRLCDPCDDAVAAPLPPEPRLHSCKTLGFLVIVYHLDQYGHQTGAYHHERRCSPAKKVGRDYCVVQPSGACVKPGA